MAKKGSPKPKQDKQILSSLERIEAHTSVLPSLLNGALFREGRSSSPGEISEVAKAVAQAVSQDRAKSQRAKRQGQEEIKVLVEVEQNDRPRRITEDGRSNVDEVNSERRTGQSANRRRRQVDGSEEEAQAARRPRRRVTASPSNEEQPGEDLSQPGTNERGSRPPIRAEQARKSEEAQEQSREKGKKKKDDGWFKKLAGFFKPGKGERKKTSKGNGDAEEAAGLAAAGSFWEAAKELKSLGDSLKEKLGETKLGKALNGTISKFFGKDSRKQERGADGRLMSVRDSQRQRGREHRAEVFGNLKNKVTGRFGGNREADRRPPDEGEQGTEASERAGREQAQESAADERTETVTGELQDRRRDADDQHDELMGAVRSSGGNSQDSGPSLDDFMGDDSGDRSRRRRRNRRGGRPSRAGRFSRVVEGGKNLFGKAGNVAKNIGGKAAVPLAGALAAYTKYNEVKDDESLTGGQKAVQVGSTATGATGGAMAGAAAGAAIGSVVPFVGTAIGGLIGAVIGGMGGEKLGAMIGEGISGQMEGVPEKALDNSVLPEVPPELAAKLEEYNATGKITTNEKESAILKQRQEAAKQNPELMGDLSHFERMEVYDQRESEKVDGQIRGEPKPPSNKPASLIHAGPSVLIDGNKIENTSTEKLTGARDWLAPDLEDARKRYDDAKKENPEQSESVQGASYRSIQSSIDAMDKELAARKAQDEVKSAKVEPEQVAPAKPVPEQVKPPKVEAKPRAPAKVKQKSEVEKAQADLDQARATGGDLDGRTAAAKEKLWRAQTTEKQTRLVAEGKARRQEKAEAMASAKEKKGTATAEPDAPMSQRDRLLAEAKAKRQKRDAAIAAAKERRAQKAAKAAGVEKRTDTGKARTTEQINAAAAARAEKEKEERARATAERVAKREAAPLSEDRKDIDYWVEHGTERPIMATAEKAMTTPVEKPVPMKSNGVPSNPTPMNSTAGGVVVNVDEKKLASAITASMNNKKPGRQVQPKASSKDIPTEFDDGLLTLMAYDRI